MPTTSTNLRRSARISTAPRPAVATLDQEHSYPDGPPNSDVERWVAKLDLQSFPSQEYALVDDILVFSLFGSKRSSKNYRALLPSRVFLQGPPPISNETGMDICHIYLFHGRSNTNSPSTASTVCEILTERYASLFSGPQDKEILKHLIQRYHIMNYTSASVLSVEKVKFGSQIACGLRAKVRVEPFITIISTCSSMSSDIVHGQKAISVIDSSPSQKGEVGPRLILGPFRFANHDCAPNCQIIVVNGTHAYALFTLRAIDAGESITVNYATDGSYFAGQQCGCATCNPNEPPVAAKRPVDLSKLVKKKDRKRTRRGGKREQRRKKAKGLHEGTHVST